MSQDRKTPRFRHRIKDLMILNGVMALIMGVLMALVPIVARNFRLVQGLAQASITGLIVLQLLVLVFVGPLALVEIYLYGKKKGTWYGLRHPTKPRPRYQRPDDLPPISPRMPVPSFLEDHPPQPRSRTRLFESTLPSEPVSRASLLLALAGRFEDEGRTEAATKVYHQILDRFTDAAEAHDAACRLRRLSEKKGQVPDR